MNTRVQFGSMWTGAGNAGYGLNCFACGACGFVGFFLGPADLQRLHGLPITQDGPMRSGSSGCLGLLLLIALGVGAIGVIIGRVLFGLGAIPLRAIYDDATG